MDTKVRRATTSAAIRARLQHPVIDADGHVIEFGLDFSIIYSTLALAFRYYDALVRGESGWMFSERAIRHA